MTVAAIVVHHRGYDTVGGTVRSLLDEGIPPARLLVVDNSPDVDAPSRLDAALGVDVRVLRVPNRGYGAAANAGVEEIRRCCPEADAILISTHECRVEPGAVTALSAVLDGDGRVGLVGPILVTGEWDVVWSAGGVLTPVLGIPRHTGHRLARSELPDTTARQCDWLDGAFVLYRAAALSHERFDENFFMYMEEVDLHLRLADRGWHVVCEPAAVVWQTSGGIPPYSLARNMQMLSARHGSLWSRIAATPWSVMRRAATGLRRGRADDVRELMAGWRDGILRRRHRDQPG